MLIEQIKTFIIKHNLIVPNSTIVLGFSGGPDSVFLLHLLTQLQKEYNLTLIAAHVDHEWRAESHSDAQFCAAMAKKLNVTYRAQKLSELNLNIKFDGSKEEYARKARRIFFEQLAKEYSANAIALGHHLQDQEETFFIRLIRGTTLTGLCAMRPKACLYIRPLIEANKNDIIDYLDKHKIEYLTDPTNVNESYLRNRIRKHVIPALQQSDKRFDANFLRTLYSLQADDDLLQSITAQTFSAITQSRDGVTWLSISKLFDLAPVLQKRVVLYWLINQKVPFVPTAPFIAEITRFLQQLESKEHAIHTDWSIVKKKDRATLAKK